MMRIYKTRMHASLFVVALLVGGGAARGDEFLHDDARQLSFQAQLSNGNGQGAPQGDYCFTFSIYDVPEDGTPLGSAQVDAHLSNDDHGVVSLLIPGSAAGLPGSLFDGGPRYLGVAIDDDLCANIGTPSEEQPDRLQIAAVPYSMRTNFVGNEELTDDVVLGDATSTGSLEVLRAGSAAPVIDLNGVTGSVVLRHNDGSSGLEMDGDILSQGGVIRGRTPPPGANLSYELVGSDGTSYQGVQPGRFTLYDGQVTEHEKVRIDASGELGPDQDEGAELRMWNSENFMSIWADANDERGAGLIAMANSAGAFTVGIQADAGLDSNQSIGDGAGVIRLRDAASAAVPPLGLDKIRLDALNDDGSAAIRMYQFDGTSTVETVRLLADATDGGGAIRLKNSAGQTTINFDGDEDDSSRIVMRDAGGHLQIVLDADYQGTGRSRGVFDEVEITGGSDLSEQFDIHASGDSPAPGMVVSIDPNQPGQLVVTRTAYDCKVAGIISGAGDVRPGMLMGQRGTAADGAHPVALSGRVYCLADVSNGAIQPGDLLTSSSTPGHAMKVTDSSRANGAILGKAMTSLTEGQGLVLVLVSLQ